MMVHIQKTKNRRHSGIELLRLIAMFMILLWHANMCFGRVVFYDVENSLVGTFGRILAINICIVAVNVYVLISGWFGIQPKFRSILNLLIQVVSYSAIGLFVLCIFYRSSFSLGLLTEIIIVGKRYWFIVSYLLLYILSPVLNSFVQHASPSVIKKVLWGFFCFEIIYGWIFGLENFAGGYSTISFIGLYLLARYLHYYDNRLIKFSTMKCCSLYCIITFIASIIHILYVYSFKTPPIHGYIYDYINPLIILSSLFLFLTFEKLHFYSEIINYLSASALAVYLIHINVHIWPYYEKLVLLLYRNNVGVCGVVYICIFAFIVMVLCLFIDKCLKVITPMSIIIKLLTKCKNVILVRFDII